MNPKGIILKSKNWNSFHTILDGKTNKEKGDAFELLVKLFFKTDLKYKSLLEDVWLLEEMPVKLLKTLNIPITDEGIDLVAKTKRGEYWSIQAKYKQDPKSSVPRKQLATFTDLSFVKSNKFTTGFICQTTNEFSRKFRDYEQLQFLTNDVWSNLSEQHFKDFKSFLKSPNKERNVKPFSPRPHQKRAIKNAKNHYLENNNKRGKLILPCGAGKSLTGYWIGRDFEAKSIVVCVPSLNLIKQTLDSWCRESYANKQDIDWICVCSDASVGKLDDEVVYTQNLGVQVDNDIDKIAQWLRKKTQKIKVVFTTYQSGKVIAEASTKVKKVFDLGIFDEAHKTVGSKAKLFSHLLFDENIKIKKRVFMTATEKRYRGSSDEILSMDNPEVYGDTFNLMTFKEAIELKDPILTDYKIITVCVDDSEYQDFIDTNTFVKPKKGKWTDEMEMKSLTSLIALRKAVNKYNIKHAITFHNSIAKAEAFQESNEKINQDYPSFKKVDTYHVTGKTNTATRTKTLKDFSEAKRAIITNARCLTEGVDVSNVDCVLFADPKKSTVDIVQAVGRALRLSKGKKYGYVILPIRTSIQNDELEIDEDSYLEIVNVLRSLASNDERIIEYFKDKSKGRKSKGKKIEIDIDAKIAQNISIKEFENELSLRVWDKLGKLNWMDFDKAREFVWELKLKSEKEWRKYCKGEYKELPMLPPDIPFRPDYVYQKTGWEGMGDWLGTGNIALYLKSYRPFKKARFFARKLNLKSGAEWRKYCKGEYKELPMLPPDIPFRPGHVYQKTGWEGMGDWLGTGNIATYLKSYRPYNKAKVFVRKLNLKSGAEWSKYCSGQYPQLIILPPDIPRAPQNVYKNKGWKSMGDWLGSGVIATNLMSYKSYTDAKIFVQKLNLKSTKEWRKYCKGEYKELPSIPSDIPSDPAGTYRDKGWTAMGDWLSTGTIAPFLISYRPFIEARIFAQRLNLKSTLEWRKYCKGEFPTLPTLPSDIPSRPDHVYKEKGWKGSRDWLGTVNAKRRLKKSYQSFNNARLFVRKLNLKSEGEWRKYLKGGYPTLPTLPSDIPSRPDYVYKEKGWNGMRDWLGKS